MSEHPRRKDRPTWTTETVERLRAATQIFDPNMVYHLTLSGGRSYSRAGRDLIETAAVLVNLLESDRDLDDVIVNHVCGWIESLPK